MEIVEDKTPVSIPPEHLKDILQIHSVFRYFAREFLEFNPSDANEGFSIFELYTALRLNDKNAAESNINHTQDSAVTGRGTHVDLIHEYPSRMVTYIFEQLITENNFAVNKQRFSNTPLLSLVKFELNRNERQQLFYFTWPQIFQAILECEDIKQSAIMQNKDFNRSDDDRTDESFIVENDDDKKNDAQQSQAHVAGSNVKRFYANFDSLTMDNKIIVLRTLVQYFLKLDTVRDNVLKRVKEYPELKKKRDELKTQMQQIDYASKSLRQQQKAQSDLQSYETKLFYKNQAAIVLGQDQQYKIWLFHGTTQLVFLQPLDSENFEYRTVPDYVDYLQKNKKQEGSKNMLSEVETLIKKGILNVPDNVFSEAPAVPSWDDVQKKLLHSNLSHWNPISTEIYNRDKRRKIPLSTSLTKRILQQIEDMFQRYLALENRRWEEAERRAEWKAELALADTVSAQSELFKYFLERIRNVQEVYIESAENDADLLDATLEQLEEMQDFYIRSVPTYIFSMQSMTFVKGLARLLNTAIEVSSLPLLFLAAYCVREIIEKRIAIFKKSRPRREPSKVSKKTESSTRRGRQITYEIEDDDDEEEEEEEDNNEEEEDEEEEEEDQQQQQQRNKKRSGAASQKKSGSRKPNIMDTLDHYRYEKERNPLVSTRSRTNRQERKSFTSTQGQNTTTATKCIVCNNLCDKSELMQCFRCDRWMHPQCVDKDEIEYDYVCEDCVHSIQ